MTNTEMTDPMKAVVLTFETDQGVVRWARLGEGGDPIVLVHGTPYSSFSGVTSRPPWR
jgi:hypothetical protein